MAIPTRINRICLGVVREAIRATGRRGVVVSGGGPEEGLLDGWLKEGCVPSTRPAKSTRDGAAHLMGVGSTEPSCEREASFLAGHILACRDGLLHLGTANKTVLLLSPTQPAHPVFPLGDVYASELLELTGAASLPPCLQGLPREDINAVDSALDAYYSDGEERTLALGRVPSEIREEIKEAWDMARKGWHLRPLIPKLGGATLGLDLDP